MGAVTIFVLCSFVVVAQGWKVTLEADRPSLRLQLSHHAKLHCCYSYNNVAVNSSWSVSVRNDDGSITRRAVDPSNARRVVDEGMSNGCRTLTIVEVQLNDTGLYQCRVHNSDKNISVYTHGTYLQVYKPMEKTINISESTKNKILTAQGILLMLCVLLPSATLLCKSKRLNELEKRKMKKEEENIYEGLNLDDCCSTYDQILRTQGQNPYQDVGNVMEEEDDIQLEKP